MCLGALCLSALICPKVVASGSEAPAGAVAAPAAEPGKVVLSTVVNISEQDGKMQLTAVDPKTVQGLGFKFQPGHSSRYLVSVDPATGAENGKDGYGDLYFNEKLATGIDFIKTDRKSDDLIMIGVNFGSTEQMEEFMKSVEAAGFTGQRDGFMTIWTAPGVDSPVIVESIGSVFINFQPKKYKV